MTVAVLVFAATLVSAETPALAAQPLTWAPPSGWQDFEEFVMPSSGGTITLDADRDYRILAPNVIRNAVHLRGGRNVVWIGGHISINDKGQYESSLLRRALVLGDHPTDPSQDGRIVHIEGLLIDGNDLSEGINLVAPSAVVQIQNIHVSPVLLRGADDRDRTGGYSTLSHPDILQPWGGFGELRVDGLTGYSTYQGLYLPHGIGTPTYGDMYFRRMNLEAVDTLGEDGYTYVGHRMMRWDPATNGQIFLDTGSVWMRHHRNSGWTKTSYSRHAYRNPQGQLVPDPPPGNSDFEDNLYPAPNLASDQLGTYATWPQSLDDGRPGVRNWTDSGPGRAYSGRPPGGPYVPSSSVGLDYVSPGYATGIEPQTTVLRPTADAFVRAVAPAFNGGTLTRLKTRGGPEVITYLRFTVPAEIGTIDRAVLRLRTLSDEETRIVVRKATPSAWGETEITYASRPRLEHRLGRANVGAEGKWVKIDVSSLINGPGSYNIAIVGRGTGPALFRSRESGSAPKLKVTSH